MSTNGTFVVVNNILSCAEHHLNKDNVSYYFEKSILEFQSTPNAEIVHKNFVSGGLPETILLLTETFTFRRLFPDNDDHEHVQEEEVVQKEMK